MVKSVLVKSVSVVRITLLALGCLALGLGVLAESRNVRVEWTSARRVLQVHGVTVVEVYPPARSVAEVRK